MQERHARSRDSGGTSLPGRMHAGPSLGARKGQLRVASRDELQAQVTDMKLSPASCAVKTPEVGIIWTQ